MEPPSPSPDAHAMALTWKLIADLEGARGDVTALAGEVLELSEAQAERVAELRGDYERERAAMLAELNRTYAGKVLDALDGPQGERFRGVLDALAALSRESEEARTEFVGVLGAGADSRFADAGAYVTPVDLTRFLDVPEDTRSRVDGLRREMNAAMGKALLARMDRTQWQDEQTWREHLDRYEQSRADAREQYAARLAEALPAEQVQKLAAMEAAYETYRNRLKDARRAAYEKLYSLLRPAGVPAE